MDAFSFEWHGEICWLAPPISLVGRAVQQVVASRCLAVLAVPVLVWPSAVFWPLLVTEFNTFRSFIVDLYLYIENGKDVYAAWHEHTPPVWVKQFYQRRCFFTARRVTFVKKQKKTKTRVDRVRMLAFVKLLFDLTNVHVLIPTECKVADITRLPIERS